MQTLSKNVDSITFSNINHKPSMLSIKTTRANHLHPLKLFINTLNLYANPFETREQHYFFKLVINPSLRPL